MAILTEDRRFLRETVVEGIAKSRVEVETAREGDEVGLLLRDVQMSDISIGMIWSGKNEALPPRPSLRTVRATHAAYGSSQ